VEEMPVADQKVSLVLVEGIDYHVEDGRWVFTAFYHLKRGFCCGNGCRHCPYSEKATIEENKEIANDRK
jgi:hypothetical protein